MIIMDSKAQLTVDVISKVAGSKISIVNAAKLLNKYRRTIERYLHQYQKIGIQFIAKDHYITHVRKMRKIYKRRDSF